MKIFLTCAFSFLLVFDSMAMGLARKKFTAIAIDADSGAILFNKDADYIGHPASLTKLFTLKMLFDFLDSGKTDLGGMIPISKHAASQQPTKLHLKPGSRISVLDAILALITHSANDVAAAIGEFIGGTEKEFAILMTQKAKAMGMRNTVFKNASGLPHAEQVTTARDMAQLARHLIDHHGQYLRYFSTTSFYFKGRNYRNHNHLLGKVEGVDCCKTGFTNASGYNLVASAKRGDKRIIAVILGGHSRTYRDNQMTKLIGATFKKFDLVFDQQTSLHPEEDEIGDLVGQLSKSVVQGERKRPLKKCLKSPVAKPVKAPKKRAA